MAMADFTANDTALLREIAHSYKLPGYSEELRQRGAELLERVASHLDQQRAAGVPVAPAPEWRQAFERAMKQTYGAVDPFKPAGQPGSYWRGEHNGIVGALQTLRENFERELTRGVGASEPPPVLRCTVCGRKSWTGVELGLRCNMLQPDKSRCGGKMLPHGVAPSQPQQRVLCERCLGAGIPWGSATQICRDCNGSGFVAAGVEGLKP
jgi:hypothetical protein